MPVSAIWSFNFDKGRKIYFEKSMIAFSFVHGYNTLFYAPYTHIVLTCAYICVCELFGEFILIYDFFEIPTVDSHKNVRMNYQDEE